MHLNDTKMKNLCFYFIVFHSMIYLPFFTAAEILFKKKKVSERFKYFNKITGQFLIELNISIVNTVMSSMNTLTF